MVEMDARKTDQGACRPSKGNTRKRGVITFLMPQKRLAVLSLLLMASPALGAEGSGFILLLFPLVPLGVAALASFFKGTVLFGLGLPQPSWKAYLKVSFQEGLLGFVAAVGWWNWNRGLFWLPAYLAAAAFVNRRLVRSGIARWMYAFALALLPALGVFLFLVFGPVGDHSPARRFEEIVRKFNGW